ncbi:MAG: NFACT family protein [Oscillospiraceae bacterium]|nr:MAG: NFACT family protein [Oscillospiraceae bacterium]
MSSPVSSRTEIDKIQQPRPDTLLISVRSEGSTKKLLLTVGSGPRLHLTRARYDNPQTAPGFCMLMRKHLTGGRISSVTQKGNERVVYIDILSGDEMGDVSLKRIAVELMGKYSNVILIGADGNIIDSIKRVGPDMSRMRLVQPHLPYIDPPSQDKLEPTAEISQISLSPVLNIPQARCSAPSPAFQSRLRRKPQPIPAALKAICPRCAAKPILPWP